MRLVLPLFLQKSLVFLPKRSEAQVARVTSTEGGAVVCGAAAGSFMPSMLIFRKVRMKIELMIVASSGSVFACNTSG